MLSPDASVGFPHGVGHVSFKKVKSPDSKESGFFMSRNRVSYLNIAFRWVMKEV